MIRFLQIWVVVAGLVGLFAGAVWGGAVYLAQAPSWVVLAFVFVVITFAVSASIYDKLR